MNGPPPEPAPPGSRLETCVLILKLLADILSVPFHFVLFLCTRRKHRRRFLETLSEP